MSERCMMDAVQREEVGARIRALRKERGWSQEKLAEEATNRCEDAKVSPRTVWSVENGQHVPQPKKLRAILDALGVAEPQGGDTLSLDGVPDDVAVFVRVATQRLCVLDEDERTRVLAALYPKLLGEFP
jgi:transcriptional regulator with XRE-family HTH domain